MRRGDDGVFADSQVDAERKRKQIFLFLWCTGNAKKWYRQSTAEPSSNHNIMNLVITLWYVWTVILICTKTLVGSQKKVEEGGEPATDIAILSRKQMVDTLKISAGSERQISKLQIFDFINAVDNIIEELNALGGDSPTFKADKYSPIVNDVRQGANVVIPTLARVGGIPLRLIKILCNFHPAPHGTALYRTYDSVVILPSSRYCTI